MAKPHRGWLFWAESREGDEAGRADRSRVWQSHLDDELADRVAEAFVGMEGGRMTGALDGDEASIGNATGDLDRSVIRARRVEPTVDEQQRVRGQLMRRVVTAMSSRRRSMA